MTDRDITEMIFRVLAAFHSAGYAVVKLPEPDDGPDGEGCAEGANGRGNSDVLHQELLAEVEWGSGNATAEQLRKALEAELQREMREGSEEKH